MNPVDGVRLGHHAAGLVLPQGISRRDWLAATAPITYELVVKGLAPGTTEAQALAEWARLRYAYADAMIAASKA